MTTQPAYIDVIDRIPHRPASNNVERERERPLSGITHQVVHFLAGPEISANMPQAEEIALLQQLARFHHTRDFGGGAKGRTLEYTYAVALSGRIYRVNRETLVVWSHKQGNYVGMSTVLLIGNGQDMSEAMKATIHQHFDYTTERADMRVVRARSFGHGETSLIYGGGPRWGNDTQCPGRALAWVRAYRQEGIPVPPDPIPNQPKNPDANGYFEITGFSINPPGTSAIGDYWRANGGVGEFGYPVSHEGAGTDEPFAALPELAGYTCQMFERKALAWRAGSPVVEVRTGALAMALLNSHGCACG